MNGLSEGIQTALDFCRASKNTPRPELRPLPDPVLSLIPASKGAADHPTPPKFTCLRPSTHTRTVSVPVGIAATRRDGVGLTTANSAPPPVRE